MLKRLILLLVLVVSGCDSLFGTCPDGQPPRTASILYTSSIDGETRDSTGQIGAETRSGDQTILTLLTADGVRLELTLYRDPAAGENYGIDTSASYENERDAGAWLGGKNPNDSLIGGGRGSVSITGRDSDSISGTFDVTYYNANLPPVTITATFEDAPLAGCA